MICEQWYLHQILDFTFNTVCVALLPNLLVTSFKIVLIKNIDCCLFVIDTYIEFRLPFERYTDPYLLLPFSCSFSKLKIQTIISSMIIKIGQKLHRPANYFNKNLKSNLKQPLKFKFEHFFRKINCNYHVTEFEISQPLIVASHFHHDIHRTSNLCVSTNVLKLFNNIPNLKI